MKKTVGNQETYFVYDAFGKLVAEYTTNQTITTDGAKFLTADLVGSPRIATDNLGQVASRHDYMPFGEEVAATVGNRSQVAGYTANDRIRQQYTGYERDGESGLDFAQNRYFSAKHGRFTSVDPFAASASAKNPQTLNRYSYALNSPYKFTDPLGLAATLHCWGNLCSTYDADDQAARGEQEEEQVSNQDDEIPPPPKWKFEWKVEKESLFVGRDGKQVKEEARPTEAQQKIIDNLIEKQWNIFYPAARDAVIAERNGTSETESRSRTTSNGRDEKFGVEVGVSKEPAAKVTSEIGTNGSVSTTESDRVVGQLQRINQTDRNAIDNTATAIVLLRDSGVRNAEQVVYQANMYIFGQATDLVERSSQITPLPQRAGPLPKLVVPEIRTNR